MIDEILEAMNGCEDFTLLDILEQVNVGDEQLEVVFKFLCEYGIVEKVSSIRYKLPTSVKQFLQKIKQLEKGE